MISPTDAERIANAKKYQDTANEWQKRADDILDEIVPRIVQEGDLATMNEVYNLLPRGFYRTELLTAIYKIKA